MAKSSVKPRVTGLMALLAALLLVFSGCGAPAGQDATVQEAATTDSEATSETTQEYDRAVSGQGLVNTFLGEQFYDQSVQNEDDALAAVQSAMDRIGGDDTTILQPLEIRPTETGISYYVFRQWAGDVMVHGASVKLAVDKDHKVCGLISSILPNVQIEDLDDWDITAEQAEKVVTDEVASEDRDGVSVVQGATEQTLIALDNSSDLRRYAWVVYTNNYLDDVDAGYLAHYVSADGEYLYSMPVSEPGNADSLAGDEANFDFDSYVESTWTGTVTKANGSTIDIEAPVLVDPETNDAILGDAKRKILCVDYADVMYNDTISPRVAENEDFDSNELLIYDTFIKVWDFYDGIGWTGPDGEGTPSLLMMDSVTKNGDVIQNASYNGRQYGFQTFAFNRLDPDGECYDIMAHEFTHCVTGTTMTANIYLNDSGAINEGMSDIMGNLFEMMVAYDENGAWLIGENEGEHPTRSMIDPHAYGQPEFAWDAYYGPKVSEGTEANDLGGVHTNSSLLNRVSYKLGQANMTNEDQFYYWMNVALALTPSCDYPQLAQLLPWCMEQVGYAQYVDAVKQAVEESRLTLTEAPATPPEGTGYVTITLPEQPIVAAENMRFTMELAPNEPSDDSPIAWVGEGSNTLMATLPAGDYVIEVGAWVSEDPVALYVLTNEGWQEQTEDSAPEYKVFTVNAGETTELTSEGLAAA